MLLLLFYYFEEKNRVCSVQKKLLNQIPQPAIDIFIRGIRLPISVIACHSCCQSQVSFLAT